MKEILDDLKRLKEGIDLAKTNLAKLDGRETELLRQLKKDHGLSSVKEAETKQVELQQDLEKLDSEIQKEYNKLKEEYEW